MLTSLENFGHVVILERLQYTILRNTKMNRIQLPNGEICF